MTETRYDPHVDIDWNAPWQHELFAMDPTAVSLYGTRRWKRLKPEQQRVLALHEAVSLWSIVSYLSAMLTGNQLRSAAEEGLNSPASRAAFVEVAGSSRTTTTFGKLARASGIAPYKLPRGTASAVKMLTFLPLGAASHASTLLVEECFARTFSAVVDDPQIEPHVRQAINIHRIESVDRFADARSKVVAAQSQSGKLRAAYNRVLLAALANVLLRLTVTPAVYRSVGMSPVLGYLASRRRRTARRGEVAAPVVSFLATADMLDGALTSRLWRLVGAKIELRPEKNS